MVRRLVRAISGVMGIILRYALSGLSCEVFVGAEGDVLMDG